MNTTDRAGNSFGLIRLVLAALVVLCHSHYLRGQPGATTAGVAAEYCGWFAVQGFFGMSGLLIAQSFSRTPAPLVFLWHRALRLCPALWASLLFSGLVLAPIAAAVAGGWTGIGAVWPEVVCYIFRNAISPGSAPHISGVFSHSPASGFINGSLWTLRYEIACYVLVGVTGALGLWRRRPAWIWAAWWVSWFLLALDRPPFEGAVIFTSVGKQLIPTFLGGMALSTVPENLREKFLPWPVVAGLGVAIAAAFAAGCGIKVAALFVPPFILGLGLRLPGRNLETRLGGDYSYGIYVAAYPLQQLLISVGLGEMNLAAFFALSMLLSIGYAVASWHLVEAPALLLKHRRPWTRFRLQFRPLQS